jgi:hypothetical protein
VIEGILAPGSSGQSPNLLWFHVTQYGKTVVQSGTINPYDPTGYLDRIKQKIPSRDATVMAYLTESLNSLRHGTAVASTVMLGIAAERVFILVGKSLENALSDPNEKRDLTRILKRYQMKPKLDWIHGKIQQIQDQRVSGFPAMKSSEIPIYAVSLIIELDQPAMVPRNQKIIIATTWRSGMTVIVGEKNLSTGVRSNVADIVDKFINDYLAVNPK